jgi:ATP-dependent Lon protease
VEASRSIPQEALLQVATIAEPGRLADTITPYLPLTVERQQEILATLDARERLQRLRALLG